MDTVTAILKIPYCNEPKFSYRLVWSADPDQPALREQSEQGLQFAIPFVLHVFDEIPIYLNFRYISAKFSGFRKSRNFTVNFFNFLTP